MFTKRGRIAVATAAAAVTFVAGTVGASAKPPAEHGTAPVSAAALNLHCGMGAMSDNNQDLKAVQAFSIKGRSFLAVAGNMSTWQDSRGTHPVSHLIIVDTASCDLEWTAPVIGPARTWIRTLTYDGYGSDRGLLYFGGSFSRVGSAVRNHAAAYRVRVVSRSRNDPWGIAVDLYGWRPVGLSQVSSLSYGGGRVIVGDAAVRSVNPFSGHQYWARTGNCGVSVVQYMRGLVFVGGFSTAYVNSDGKPYNHYGVAKLRASTGTFYRSFGGTLTRNERTCRQPSSGYQTYSGSIALSMHPYGSSGLIVGAGGKRNKIGLLSSTGTWRWLRGLDGDGQTVATFHGDIFGGHHRSGHALIAPKNNYGAMGGWYSATGVQMHWPLSPDFAGGGNNADGSNNGMTGSTMAYVNGRWRFIVVGAWTSGPSGCGHGFCEFPVAA